MGFNTQFIYQGVSFPLTAMDGKRKKQHRQKEKLKVKEDPVADAASLTGCSGVVKTF